MNFDKESIINDLSSYNYKKLKSTNSDMKELANDISMNLPEASILMKEEDLPDIDNIDEESTEYLLIPSYLKDPLIIIISYTILSQNIIQKNIGKYISLIKPREDGTFSQISIFIYGVFIALLFSLIRITVS
tara:strand:+ start:421 stop:816 length:396 start_codon:yes stop_codon:yes gene_type:complete